MTGARKALIVASDTYEHEGLRRLRSPQADAEALAAVLSDPQIGGFDVGVVHNGPSYEVQGQVEALFADSRPEDLLLLHFACHGVKNESGELYFAARNTRLDRLASTAVSADFVQRCMRSSRSRSIVLLLDCCYGGAFGNGVSVRAAGPVDVLESFPSGVLDGGRGRAVITASSAMEYAFEGDTLADDRSAATSVFTDALVRGLATGEADRDEDGWVSLNELYDYVFDRVRTTTPGQTPTRNVEMQGELYLARSRRRRVKAAPVPPDLLAASHDANVFARLGAVTELRARLLGDNLPSAAGAHHRLVEIADGDIRYVAEAASGALAEAALDVSPADLDFGDVPQGAEPPRLAADLRGPPLARACSFEASDRRIRVEETADGFEVTVDTARVGPIEGTVTVTGPTGARRVAVHAVITARAAPADTSGPADAGPADAGGPADGGGPDDVGGPADTGGPADGGRLVAASRPADASGPAHAGGPVDAGPPVDKGAPAHAGAPVDGRAPADAAAPAAGRAPAPAPAPPAASTEPGPGEVRPRRGAGPARFRTGALSRWPPLAASTALVGATLLAVGVTSPFVSGSTLRDGQPELFWHALVMASLVAAAALLLLAPRTRRPAGTGLFLAMVASSTWGLVVLSTAWWNVLLPAGEAGVGFWLMLAGQVTVLLAGAVVVRAVARLPEAAVGPAGLGRARRLLVVVGLLGAAAMVIKAADPVEWEWDWAMAAWVAVLAAGLPLAGALAPPGFGGRWLVAGWGVGGGAVLTAYLAHHARLQADSPSAGTAAVEAFGITLLLLVALAVVDARRNPGAVGRRPEAHATVPPGQV